MLHNTHIKDVITLYTSNIEGFKDSVVTRDNAISLYKFHSLTLENLIAKLGNLQSYNTQTLFQSLGY